MVRTKNGVTRTSDEVCGAVMRLPTRFLLDRGRQCARRRPQLSLISSFPRRQRPDELRKSVNFPIRVETDDRGPALRTKISGRRPTLASEVPAGPNGPKGITAPTNC